MRIREFMNQEDQIMESEKRAWVYSRIAASEDTHEALKIWDGFCHPGLKCVMEAAHTGSFDI